jgi:hypothetical protein
VEESFALVGGAAGSALRAAKGGMQSAGIHVDPLLATAQKAAGAARGAASAVVTAATAVAIVATATAPV